MATSGDKIELPADLRAKIERMVCDLFSRFYGDNREPTTDEVNALFVARSAATLAVEHERELVCDLCGQPWASPVGRCSANPKHDPMSWSSMADPCTRAEFERRKEAKP